MEFINKTFSSKHIEMELMDTVAEMKVIGDVEFKAEPGEKADGTIMLIYPKDQVKANSFKIPINVLVEGEVVHRFEASFIAPITN